MNRAKCSFLAAMTIFGTVGIFVRYIPLPSASVAFFRGVLGFVFLILAMTIFNKKPDFVNIRKALPILLLSGAAIGGNWILLFESYRHTTVAVATICYYMAPAFVVLASPLLLSERLTGRKLLLLGVALVGMVFVSGVLKGGVSGGKGTALGVGAAILYASVMLLNRKLKTVPAYDKTAIQLGAAATVILPYCLLSGGFDMEEMTATGYILLAVVGIIHTGFAYWLYFGAMGKMSSQSIAIFSYLDPVIAIVLSALWLKEPLDWQGIVGAVLILGSALCSELPVKKM